MAYFRPQGRQNINNRHMWPYSTAHLYPQRPIHPIQYHVNVTKPKPNLVKTSKPINGINKDEKSMFRRILDTFVEFCGMTSLHGLKFVADKRENIAERIFWLLSFCCAVTLATYFIVMLYTNYETNPAIISFNPTPVYVHEIPFPALTICNANIAMKSRVERLFNENNTEAQRQVIADMCGHNRSQHEQSATITWRTVEETVLNTTQRCGEMLVACRWQGVDRNCRDIFGTVINDDGFCCTFNRQPLEYFMRRDTYVSSLTGSPPPPPNVVTWNCEDGYPANATSDSYPYRAFGRGVDQGLSLVLNADIEEYYCSSTSSVGFKLFFATPTESPKMSNLAFMVPPGVEMRIPVDVHVSDTTDAIRAISWDKRNCFYPKERFLHFYRYYSQRNCLLECEANYTLKMCGCVAFDMPGTKNNKICERDDDECVTIGRRNIERYGPDKAECNCLPGCFEITYKPDLLSMGTLQSFNGSERGYMQNFTKEYYIENIAILHIYYNADRFQKLTKNVLYGFPEFLSQTGGLLGLFLGLSFISVVEIVYFFFMQTACKWAGRQLQADRVHHEFIN